jgi:S-acyl fatty acid synthase thioesterase, medium chain
MKLICFTYAGGNSSFYDQLKNELLPNVNLIAAEYSGHGTRHRSPFYSDFDELANDMLVQIEKELDEKEPFAIMGYSMGSIAAIEVLSKLMVKKMPLPIHVFLAAHEPHTKAVYTDYNRSDIDEFVKARTIQFGAVPEKLINNKSFWRMYLPIYRADYSIIGKYKFENLKLKSDIPATVFYSESDTPFANMKNWDRYFEKIDFVKYSGSHFFIHEHFCAMAQEIKKRLV